MHFDSAMAVGHVAGSDSAFASTACEAPFSPPDHPHRHTHLTFYLTLLAQPSATFYLLSREEPGS